MTDMNPTVTWSVVMQNDVTRYADNGVPTPGVDVTYETSTGIRAVVFIPTSVYRDRDAVRAAIAADAAHRVGVANLSGSV